MWPSRLLTERGLASRPCNTGDFVVPYARYEATQAARWAVGDAARVLFDRSWASGVVDELGEGDWESVKVRWEDDVVSSCSTWELAPMDQAPPQPPSTLSDADTDAFVRTVNEIIRDNDALVEFFLEDPSEYEGYTNAVAAPVWLFLLLERAQNHYYRSQEHLEADVRRLSENCVLFNSVRPPSLIY